MKTWQKTGFKKTTGHLLLGGLFLALAFSACRPAVEPGKIVALQEDSSRVINDTAGFFSKASVTYSGSQPAGTHYHFGDAFILLNRDSVRQQLHDTLADIGFYEETQGVVHEMDTATFALLLKNLFGKLQMEPGAREKLSAVLLQQYKDKLLFKEPSGFAIRNFCIGGENGNAYISLQFSLCTTTVLAKITRGEESVSNGGTTTRIPVAAGAGRLGFQATAVHVKPADEKTGLPVGYFFTNHRGLEMGKAMMCRDTATAASPGKFIVAMKPGLD